MRSWGDSLGVASALGAWAHRKLSNLPWSPGGLSQNLPLERGLACIVQSWFFCFQLALPSPFRSCADVKGCEVTARGRYWVGVGRRGGPGQAGPSCCRYAEFLLHWCCLILQRLCRRHVSELKINCNQKICRIVQEKASLKKYAHALKSVRGCNFLDVSIFMEYYKLFSMHIGCVLPFGV